MESVEVGKLAEADQLSSGLDYYKATMSQLEYAKHPDLEVTFTFHNRGKNLLTDFVDPMILQARLDYLGQKGWSREELNFLAQQLGTKGERLFSEEYLDWLADQTLPPITVGTDPKTSDLTMVAIGQWPMVTFWETVAMSEANEMYFENYVRANGIDLDDVYEEGDRRLTEKINYLKDHPDMKIADFGTRRRFSLRWQKHVVERFVTECPENFIGTSNINLARTFDVWPIGTFAHELPMVYAGLADATGHSIPDSQTEMFDDWHDFYGENLSTILPDTYRIDFFFSIFTREQAEQWKALRHDSGDPDYFVEKTLNFYASHDIDPKTKTIVFSNISNFEEAVRLYERYNGQFGMVFGIGGAFINDLPLPTNKIVMKATHIRIPATGQETDLVKESDDEGKQTGPADKLAQYAREKSAIALSHTK